MSGRSEKIQQRTIARGKRERNETRGDTREETQQRSFINEIAERVAK